MFDLIGNARRWGAWVLLAAIATLMVSLPVMTQPNEITLRSLAQERCIGIGAAVSMPALRKDATYREVLAREFNWVTPENVMKFEPLHPERDRYNFDAADTLVEFAQLNVSRGRPLYRRLTGGEC